jgi:hypothetical protein
MADTVAMNSSDFIITSTYQEIAGRFVNQLKCPFIIACMIRKLSFESSYIFAAKIDLDSMKVMPLLLFRGFVGLFQG